MSHFFNWELRDKNRVKSAVDLLVDFGQNALTVCLLICKIEMKILLRVGLNVLETGLLFV